MISVLFESELLLKETSFGTELVYQSEFKLLKRKNTNLGTDIEALQPDVLFINLSIKFFKKVKLIYKANQNIKIVLLVNYYCDHICWIAKKFKIGGVLLRSVSINEFNTMVTSIYDSSDNLDINKCNSTIDFDKIEELLTQSEIKIFKFVGMGVSTIEISERLNLSKRTIDNHRMKILKKLGCKESSRLIYIASIYNLFKIT